MLTQPTIEKLCAMRLRGMAEAFQQQQEDAHVHSLSFEERLGLLIDRQWNWRQNRALERRLRNGRLQGPACIEDIDYRTSRGLERQLVRSLTAESAWVREHQHLFLIGPTGIGKTWLARALAQKACRDGYAALFVKAAELFRDLAIARADGSHGKMLNRLGHVDLLIVDDWAMAPMTEPERRDFLEICDVRYQALPSSQATGARQIGRLTNLMQLNVDTSWYTRYRSTQNPDFGVTFPQAVNITNQPVIPLNDHDTPPTQSQPVPPGTPQQARMQAIANAAGFHFALFDSAGSSVYTTLSFKVTSPEVLRIVVSILGVEVNHFAVWHDKAGNAVSQPLAGVKDPETGVTFPDLNAPPFGGEAFQTNLIFPEPCEFIAPGLPACAVIRPSLQADAGAVATATAVAKSQLFLGQPQAFFDAVTALAMAADAAQRGHGND